MIPQPLAYFKLEGSGVRDGIFDARKTAEALLGVDELIRATIHRKIPELSVVDFEFPVEVETGSIVINIPENIGWLITKGLVATGIGRLAYVWAKAYLEEAGKQMGKADFEDVGVGTIVKAVIAQIQDVIRLGKHKQELGTKEFSEVTIDCQTQMIGIVNGDGRIEVFHKSVLEDFASYSQKSFARLASLIEKDIDLVVGIEKEDAFSEERITVRESYLFKSDDGMGSTLFPELVHGMHVKLTGETTRGTLTTNSIGFRYNNHILNCTPRKGDIIAHKQALFSESVITGDVDRTDDDGKTLARKPRIIFDSLEPVMPAEPAQDLFPDGQV